MKYLRIFKQSADYQEFTGGGEYVTPNVCYIEETDGIVMKPYDDGEENDGSGKIVNHITYTVSDKSNIYGYQFTFYSEYPVNSSFYIGLSNGNRVQMFIGEGISSTRGPLDLGILGLSFINGGPFISEIEDDLYIYI
jgi:hypothetical protein